LKPLNKSQSIVDLVVEYSPSTIGSIRLFKQLEASFESMKELGFPDSQFDEIISIFTDTNFVLLFLTFAVSLLHVRNCLGLFLTPNLKSVSSYLGLNLLAALRVFGLQE
jgi:hypothetical protein